MSEELQRIVSRATSEALQLAGRSILTALFVTAEVLIHLDLGARSLFAYARSERGGSRADTRADTIHMIAGDGAIVVDDRPAAPLRDARTDYARTMSPRAAASCARGNDRGLRRIAC